MADIVADGAKFQCDKGGMQGLKVIISPAEGDSKTIAANGNCLLMPQGGACSLLYGAPCPIPTPIVTKEAQKPVVAGGMTALGKGCEFQCPMGGKLSATSTAQSVVKHNEAEGGEKPGDITAVTAVIAALAQMEFAEADKSSSDSAANDNHALPSQAANDNNYQVVASHLWEPRENEQKIKKEDSKETDKENIKEFNKESFKDYRTKSDSNSGIQIHKKYREHQKDEKKGQYKEKLICEGNRPDFIDASGNPIKVYDLKPNNPKQIREGKKQIKRYIENLKRLQNDKKWLASENFQEFFEGKDIIGIVEVY